MSRVEMKRAMEEAYRLKALGLSVQSIAEELTKSGYRGYRGKAPKPQTVASWLWKMGCPLDLRKQRRSTDEMKREKARATSKRFYWNNREKCLRWSKSYYNFCRSVD